MKPIKVFLDAEFTDHSNPQLISIALVTETGNSFYAVLTDGWDEDACSTFVLDTVLPLLDEEPAQHLSRAEAAVAIAKFLNEARNGDSFVKLEVIFDLPTDWDLLVGLFCKKSEISAFRDQANIAPIVVHWALDGSDMDDFNQAMECYWDDVYGRHNALIDARALQETFVRFHNK